MFKKCLKYDLRAFGKIWLIAAAVVLLISILGAFGIGGLVEAVGQIAMIPTDQRDPGLWFYTQLFIGLISLVAVFSSAVVFLIGTEIAVCLRYYNHLFTDQGYLTFTLPVKRSTLFWSKTLSGYLFILGSSVVYLFTFLSVGLGVGGGILVASIKEILHTQGWTLAQFWQELKAAIPPDFIRMIFDLIKEALGEIGALNILRVLIIGTQLLTFALVSMFTSLMVSYACITLGATMFRKLKLLSVLVTYYVINNVLTVPFAYISTYYGMFASAIGSVALPKLFENLHVGMSVVYLALTILILSNLCVGVALAIFNVTRIERKLNLA